MRIAAGLLVACLLSTPAIAGPLVPDGEMHVGDSLSPRAVQDGTLIFFKGMTGEVDHSDASFEWPKAIKVRRGEHLRVIVDVPKRPSSVELTYWRSIRRSGRPKQRIARSECFVDPLTVDACELSFGLNEGGHPSWAVVVDSPVSRGNLYAAANFTWDDSTASQAVWLFHVRLPKR